jgi:calcium channel MID1
MRQYSTLRCYLIAISIFLTFYVSSAFTYDNLNIASDGAGLPVALDSFNGLELRNSINEAGESNGLDLVRRIPNAAKSLGNNQFVAVESFEIGAVRWFYLSKDIVNGPHATDGKGLPAYVSDGDGDDGDTSHELRKRKLAERATTTVYLSLTTCAKPTSNKTDPDDGFPQLEVYVSKSDKLENPGPGEDDDLQDKYTAVGGYVGITKDTDSDVFIGVAAPNSTDYTGIYKFQIAASIDAYFHSVVEDEPNLYLIDADVSAALLVTNNLTESNRTSENYHQWMNMVPPYTMFAHNINNTALVGLERSFCALDALSQVGRISNSTEVGMTSRGLGNKPKEQFYITGLNASSYYNGLLAMVGNSTSNGNGIVGGGGQVWKPMNFTTKAGKPIPFSQKDRRPIPSNNSQMTTAPCSSTYPSAQK